MPKEVLKIAIIIDSYAVPAWIAEGLGRLTASSRFTAPIVVCHGFELAGKSFTALFWRLQGSLDRTLFSVERDPDEVLDVRSVLPAARVIEARPNLRDGCLEYSTELQETLQEFGLDIAWNCGSRPLSKGLLRLFRNGVWSLRHGDLHHFGGEGPPGLAEMIRGDPVVRTSLVARRHDEPRGRLLIDSHASTNRYSTTRNRANFCWKSSAFVPRELESFPKDDTGALPGSAEIDAAPSRSSGARQPIRSWIGFGGYLAWKLHRKLLFREQWVIGVQQAPEVTSSRLWQNASWLIPPKDRFWADPFIVNESGAYHLFFEEFLYRKGKAHLCVRTLGPAGDWGPSHVILDQPYHLSYPHVIEWDGAYYMIPESHANGTVDLYRCVEFPRRWRHDRTLLSGLRAVDATPVHHDGRWWLFLTAGARGAAMDDELFIFFADDIHGPWHPHPCNPVKSDVRNARPAGRIFIENGRLYRPAQDCSVRFGYAVVVNRIEELSPRRYLEGPDRTIRPQPESRFMGIHTLNSDGEMTVFDAVRYLSRL